MGLFGSKESSSESFPPTQLANGTWMQRFIINGKEEIRPFYGRPRDRQQRRNRPRYGETPKTVEKEFAKNLATTIASIPKSGQVDGQDQFHHNDDPAM